MDHFSDIYWEKKRKEKKEQIANDRKFQQFWNKFNVTLVIIFLSQLIPFSKPRKIQKRLIRNSSARISLLITRSRLFKKRNCMRQNSSKK